MQNKYFRLVSHALLLFHRSLIIKACKIFVILQPALCDTLTREFQWKFQKTITEHRKRNSESHISQTVNGMSLSIGRLTAVLESSFPNFNLTCKGNSIHYSLLIVMFRKAEMRVKR